MMMRTLGRSGIRVSALGLGTNAIGGVYWDSSGPSPQRTGYGQVDEAEAVRAMQRALHLGVNFFDTADEYGCGRSEKLLGQAIRGRREQVVISSKFGYTFDEASQHAYGPNASPAYIRKALEGSLRRLNTSYLDIYLLHLRDLDFESAAAVRETLEELVAEGKIRYYGWSTDDIERARFFAAGPHCTAIEHRLNIFIDAGPMLALCEELDLGSINRIPLLMGVLTGKFTPAQLPPEDDIRRVWFSHSKFGEEIDKLDRLRAILNRDGRSLVQAALGWIWARSPRAVPVPGFKTTHQIEENIAAMQWGALSEEQMEEIDRLLGRAAA